MSRCTALALGHYLLAEMVGPLALVLLFLQAPGEYEDGEGSCGALSDHSMSFSATPVHPPAIFVKDLMAMPSLVAVVSKVVRDVVRKEIFSDWQSARRGEVLSSGARVKTGDHSVAVLKLMDNSFVRVRERSELTIKRIENGSSFSTSVSVECGGVGFHISKQRDADEFRFTSPTSVASIRGTGGRFVSHCLSDTLTLVDGVVVFTNVHSAVSVEVRAGYTGISRPDGTISVRLATPAELSAAGSPPGEDVETLHVVKREGRAAGRRSALFMSSTSDGYST